MSEEQQEPNTNVKIKGKLTLTARLKKAGTDEWIDLGVLDQREASEEEVKNGGR